MKRGGAILVWLFFVALPAAAQEGPRMVIAQGDHDALERGLVAELLALGFRAERRALSLTLEPAELDARAAELDTDALVSMRDLASGLEVWLADRVTGKVTVRVLPGGAPDARTATLQVLELLRASFLEIETRAFAGEAAPALEEWVSDALAPTLPRRRTLTAHLGAALSLDPGGLPPGAHVEADVALQLDAGPVGLGAHAWVYAPTAPLTVSGPEGAAQQTFLLAGLGVQVFPVGPGSPVDVRVGARGGLLWMQSAGVPSPGYEARTVEVVSLTLGGDVRALWWVLDALALDLGASVLWAAPTPTLVFETRRVAVWAMPVVLVSVGLTLGLEDT